jgi:hypothetical protein
MLIAMKAKTFDNVWEASEVNHLFLFARLVYFQRLRPPEPPPLIILKWPATVISLGLIGLTAILPRQSAAYRAVRAAKDWFLSGFEYSSIVNIAKDLERRRLHEQEMQDILTRESKASAASSKEQAMRKMTQRRLNASARAAENTDKEGEYIGTFVRGRNTFEMWKRALGADGLREFVTDFMVKREDDVAQEERWRSKMMKRLGQMFDRVGERIDGLQDRMDMKFDEIERKVVCAAKHDTLEA